jgi:catechol 2,3-dioxygenase-like lactoylglutathione lyase family enzyme
MEGRRVEGNYRSHSDRPDHGFVDTSYNLRLEIDAAKSQTAPITSDHIHFLLVAASIPDAQAWYVKIFGAKPINKNQAELPGVRLAWIATKTPTNVLSTKGQTLDHFSFEVTNLEAFRKKLEANGIKFEDPYSKTRRTSFASAQFDDPWGATIEMTEGLNRL